MCELTNSDSSLPGPEPPRDIPAHVRHSAALGTTHAASVDHSAPYARYRWLPGGARALRRQWSLERGDVLAAVAASAEPLALAVGPAPRAVPRYRTRRDLRDDEPQLA